MRCTRQRNRQVIEALIDAVRDGAIGEQGGKAALAGIEQRGMALDVEVGLLLPGKAGIWQILGRSTAADGNIHGVRVAVSASDHRPRGWRLRVPWAKGGQHGLAHLAAALAEIGEVVGIQVLEQDGDLLIQVRLVQKRPTSAVMAKPGGTHTHGG